MILRKEATSQGEIVCWKPHLTSLNVNFRMCWFNFKLNQFEDSLVYKTGSRGIIAYNRAMSNQSSLRTDHDCPYTIQGVWQATINHGNRSSVYYISVLMIFCSFSEQLMLYPPPLAIKQFWPMREQLACTCLQLYSVKEIVYCCII